jgi:hypothetical protein
VQHNEVYYPSKRKNLVAQKIAVPRARDSVRRASDFVQIAISLIDGSMRTTPDFYSYLGSGAA